LLGEKRFDLRRIGLGNGIFSKGLIEGLEKGLRRNAMAQAGNELDIFLNSASEIKNGEAFDAADAEEKLLQAAALALKLNFFFLLSAGAAAWSLFGGLAEKTLESIGKQTARALPLDFYRN